MNDIQINDNFNKERQQEELEAISSIYGDEFYVIEPENQVYMVRVSADEKVTSPSKAINLQFRFTAGYPSTEPLAYEIQAPWLRGPAYDQLDEQLRELCVSSLDAPVVHMVVETVRTFLQQQDQTIKPRLEAPAEEACDEDFPTRLSHSVHTVPSVQCHMQALPSLLPIAVEAAAVEIAHGETLVDRKSVFQAHCSRVRTVGQVSRFISTLLEDRKIAAATHNILAWRIVDEKRGQARVIHADCDDDGETHAGSRLLHLLTISDAENVVVMVSRWYGGIQLGPDRFKHINNVARQLLTEQGFLKTQTHTSDTKMQKQKKKKR